MTLSPDVTYSPEAGRFAAVVSVENNIWKIFEIVNDVIYLRTINVDSNTIINEISSNFLESSAIVFLPILKVKSTGGYFGYLSGGDVRWLNLIQDNATIPLLSGSVVSGEQSNKTIPFVQNFNPINVFRMSAEGSIERDNLLIKIMDEYRGFNGLLSSANAADIITSDADFGGEKSMSFSGETYNTGITLKGGLFGILFTWKRNSPNSLNRILLNDDGDFYIDTANGYSLVFSVDSAISWTFPNLTIDVFDANLIYLQVDFLTGEGFVKFGSKTVFISGLTPLGSIDTIFNVINDTSSNGYKTTELNIFNFDTLNNQGEINDFINPKANAITAATGLAWNNLI
jgi:hypothetical protein